MSTLSPGFALRAGCETGEFQAMMDVELVNDGLFAVILDSEKVFWPRDVRRDFFHAARLMAVSAKFVAHQGQRD